MAHSGRMQEEIELLQSALRDIAQALIQDAELKDPEITQAAATHIHLSTTPVPQKYLVTYLMWFYLTIKTSSRSPKRGCPRNVTSSAAFAESTISAVQAALHKYQSLIHELQVNIVNYFMALKHIKLLLFVGETPF